MIKIAIVEDNKIFREALIQLINAQSNMHLVGEFASAEYAVKEIPHILPDIVIADIEMNGMNGIEMITILKHTIPAIEFLVCTIHDNTDMVFDALRAGACGYILKDSGSESIIKSIIELYNGGAPMSPFIAKKVISEFSRPKQNNFHNLLTEREIEILQYTAKGLLNKEIASLLFLSNETVKSHLRNIYVKLQVSNKIEALHKVGLL